MQSGVLVGGAPYALPLKHKLLPEFLNDFGYKSIAVGKWHLGSHSANYTPTRRGFASHLVTIFINTNVWIDKHEIFLYFS